MPGHFPLDDDSVDIVWVCSVLDGLDDDTLRNTIDEIDRVLCVGGLLFLAEDSPGADAAMNADSHWVFRSPSVYQELLPFYDLRVVARYRDWDDEVAVMLGRREAEESRRHQ